MSTEWRHLTDDELRLVRALLSRAAVGVTDQGSLESVRVVPMDDGGMGSLEFEQRVPSRNFSREVSEVTFHDADGVPVSASLNVNQSNELKELDIFKADFSPLVRIAAEFGPSTPR